MARLRCVLTAAAMLGVAACRVGSEPSRRSLGIDPSDPAAQACLAHPTVDACLADQPNRCFWGPNWRYPVQVDQEPCQPVDGICQSALSPPAPELQCTTDPTNDAACAAYDARDACAADLAHRCWWSDMVPMMPCSSDGTGCGPWRQCFTRADCPPRCGSSGPTISVGVYGGCGCLTPPGGVCIAPSSEPTAWTGCAERPACDAADVCACLTGLGTCVAGEAPNVCVCTGA
jgi:hypothetical protein